jgi:HD-like signal output (HDOD) protein
MLTIEQLLKESEHIEPVPQVVRQLMDLEDDPDVSASEITELILYEPVVTANLLKLTNSAALGFKRKVDSVHDAVVLLGLKRLIEIVLLNSVTRPLKSAQQGYGLEEGQLWKQSVSCALMASSVADIVDRSVKHVVFTAALLKDIGVIVMDRYVHEALDQIRTAIRTHGLNLVAAERRVLGIDHAHLGGQMAEKWNFSQTLAVAISNHHLTHQSKTVATETAMVYLADSMCSMSGINADLFSDNTADHDRIRKQLNLEEKDVNRIMSDFYSRKEAIYGLLAIL